MKDTGVVGLLGLYGKEDKPRCSYQNTIDEGKIIRRGETVRRDGISYAGIDVVLNLFSKEEILSQLNGLKSRKFVKIMIHEQYFYSDYPQYQPDFEEKICAVFELLRENGFKSAFFEECL